jgi:DNA-binding CsgD family transcriptional regulator
MIARSLSYLADCLLSEADRDPHYPFYTEDSYRRKIGKSAERDRKFSPRTPEPAFDRVTRREWREILLAARLTQRQHEIVVRRLAGWTFEEIGRRYGHTKQGSESIWRQAKRKIIAAHASYRYVGLAEVYRSEVRRGLGSNSR